MVPSDDWLEYKNFLEWKKYQKSLGRAELNNLF